MLFPQLCPCNASALQCTNSAYAGLNKPEVTGTFDAVFCAYAWSLEESVHTVFFFRYTVLIVAYLGERVTNLGDISEIVPSNE